MAANLDQETLFSVIKVLYDCRNPETIQQAYQQIIELNKQIDFNFYLVCIAQKNLPAKLPEMLQPMVDVITRMNAFILVKNNCKTEYSRMSDSLKSHVKNVSMELIADENRQIRHTSGILMTSILSLCNRGFMDWPELLPKIIELLTAGKDMSSVPEHMIEGIFFALDKICEDCSDAVELDLSTADQNINGWQTITNPQQPRSHTRSFSQRNSSFNYSEATSTAQTYANIEDCPLYKLMPHFIAYFEYPNTEIQALAVACCNHFIVSRTQVLSKEYFLDAFINGLFKLALGDNNESGYQKIQGQVCKALVLLLEVQEEALEQHMEGIVDYMLHQTKHGSGDVALEACEFWLTLAEQSETSKEVLKQNKRLGELVPILIKRMKYEPGDPVLIKAEQEENNAGEEDEETDIKPRHCKAKRSLQVS